MFPFVPDAMAQDGAAVGGLGATFIQMAPLLLIFVIFYFLLIRPQQKKQKAHQEMLASLKKGDRVVTNGGVFGTVYKLGESVITLEISDKVRIQLERHQVARLAQDTNTKKNEKSDKNEKAEQAEESSDK